MVTNSFGEMHFLLLLLLAPLVYTERERIVVTNNGPVKGTFLKEKNVVAFLGIPYAEPPVGSLRFAKPVPKSSWEDTYKADKLPVACIQAVLEELTDGFNLGTEMSEDCLYLNIWVPEGGKELKPIMVFIHGGAFMVGSSNMNVYDGAALSERGDIIVASINYRVGSLGFFSGFIDEASGNMGMYDQLMAIQWIKDNAKHFSGDPENIVLFGESAGSFSVSLHMVSPLSRNLFKRGILQSGSAFHPMYSDDNKILHAGSQAIAGLLGCADDGEALKKDPKKVVECMKSLPAEKFSEKDVILFHSFGMLLPRVGDDFLPINPIDSFRKGDSKKSNVLVGVTRDEGSFLLGLFRPKIFGAFGEKVGVNDFNETSAKAVLQSILSISYDDKIAQSFLDRAQDESRYSYLHAMSDVIGDYFITCGSIFQADYESLNGNPVFYYVFDYRPTSSPLPEWLGVPHFAEVPFVFGNPLFNTFSEQEEELSKDMMDMWIAFAKTGNPNIPRGLKWPRYTYKDPKHFVIGVRDRVGLRPDNYRCDEWKNFFRLEVDTVTI